MLNGKVGDVRIKTPTIRTPVCLFLHSLANVKFSLSSTQ